MCMTSDLAVASLMQLLGNGSKILARHAADTAAAPGVGNAHIHAHARRAAGLVRNSCD